MSVIRKDVGLATAYGYAQEKGYTGTEEEFAELMYNITQVAEEAEGYAQQAAASAQNAGLAASSAGSSMGQAMQAASNASASATSAESSASAAASSASSAGTSASTAGTKASEAAQSANLGEAYATEARGAEQRASVKASNAESSATAANTSALKSEGYAIGKQNGSDVGSSSPYYHNNAEYYADQAAESARTLTIDDTLTQTGQAADAKKTGDEINDLKANLTDLLEVKNDFDWTAGYITAERGEAHSQTDFYQYYSELILAGHFKTMVITPSNGRQVSIASYDKETGAFVSRSSYTTTKITIDNTYNVRINVALTSHSSIEVTKEEQLQNISVLQDFYLSDSDIMANNIVVESIYVQDGGVASAQQTDKYVKVTNIELKKDDEITAVNGYQFAVYTSGNSFITNGWQTSYTMEAAYSGAKIVIRKLDALEPIDKSEDGLTLLSYIRENYKSTINKAYILTDLTIADINSRIDVNKRWFNKKAAFVGDSITFGVHTTKVYYEILNEKIGFSDVYSDGVTGSSYSVTAIGGYKPITQRWQDIPTDRDLVVIFAGTNDWGHNTPLGTIADTTDVSFYGAISVVINGILEANPDVRLVLMTPLHRWGYTGGNYPNDTDNNGQGHPLVDYVNAIKEIAELYGVPVIDVFSISGLNPRISAIKTGYMTDGLHPDTSGHVLLADRIEPQLEIL